MKFLSTFKKIKKLLQSIKINIIYFYINQINKLYILNL